MQSTRLYDISRTISPTLVVWPGSTAFHFEHELRIQESAFVNLTTLTLTPHTGSHTDAPYHIVDDDLHPADMPLEPYIGPAHVVTIERQAGGIVPADFDGHNLTGVQRLLIHTWVSALPDNVWPDNFPHPTVELIDWLAVQGGVLLGLDSPSVDHFDSQTLPCHHRLRHHNMANLELLCLDGVPDGLYELVALPLKMADVCGSPVRAVLRELD